MGYETSSTSQDGQGADDRDEGADDRDEDDEDEYEEVDGDNRLLGFMFGNVDDSGDLDVDYLDEDAKEHFGALANQLGSSLTDIALSVKSSQRFVDAAEQDYAQKAEDAVDYEDIDEQYEGPEIQAVTEEDYLLPKENYISSKLSASTSTSVFDDENYDEDEDEDDEPEKEHTTVDNNIEVQTTTLSGEHGEDIAVQSQKEDSPEEIPPDDGQTIYTLETENLTADPADFQKEDADTLEEPIEAKSSTPLPILCIEDGTVILRFSEIFAIQEPLKKAEKRDRWYSHTKEKYKGLDITDIIEEDEETFLKDPSKSFSYKVPAHIIQDDFFTPKDDESEYADFKVVQGDGTMALEAGDPRKNSCHSDVPMNEDASLVSVEWSKPSYPEYYPLDQQDWENRIIWDNSPASTESATESCEMSWPEPEGLVNQQSDSVNSPRNIQAESRMEHDEKEYGVILPSHLAFVEPLGSRNSPRQLSLPEEGERHPQLLRLESRFETDNINLSDGREDPTPESDPIRRFSKLTLRNKDIMDGSWLEKIIWEPRQSISKPKLILDLQDEQMLFEILDSKDGNHLQLHAGSMIMTRAVKSTAGDPHELHSHGGQSVGRFNIANDKFYSNRKSSQQMKSHSKKRTAHSVKVLHSIPALKLQTMKTKLSNKDIANFHRPKALWYPHDYEMALKEQGKLPTQGPMKIILKSLGGKGSKLHVDAEETISSIKAKATKKLDFKQSEPVKIIYSGKELEDHKSLTEQNVRTNSLLHLVRTNIHLLPKAQKLPGENKSLRPPGAFKKKSDLSVKDGHVFLMEYCEERPLLLGNPGMGARLCTYYQKSTPGDQTGTLLRNGDNNLGSVLTLDPADKSPFLGDIKAGCSQSCLETNMYRAPIFSHKVPLTDYLLVRSAKGKLSIRRIDRVDVVGQQEPHMEVMSPVSKGVQIYNMNRLLVYMYREFRALQKRGLTPSIRANELSAQFPNVAEVTLKKRLKLFCDFQRGSWVMRRNFRIPLEEELRRMITPENVCAYESMLAGLYRLKRLGISMTHPAGLSSAMNQLPDEAIALAAASHIERELQITPWNLSSNFVACTNQDRENIERLEITGVGDPSGRGLGFSYVRTAPKAPISNAMAKKKIAVNRGGSTVTGTDADLRRLSMEAAREVLLKFNVPDEQIAKLTRWHRIAMIRKLSSEQAASGVKVDPTTISKYARGQRMSFLQLQQQTREKCQEIWDRQVQSLSAIEGEEMESDTEANSDLDSFAGDLENLLDAEEFEVGEEGDCQSNHDNAVGVKGLKMRRRPSQAQAEEEIEDEAAEAAELCKMLMDDEEAERKRKKKARSMGEVVAPRPQVSYGLKNERVKKINTMIKPTPSAIQPYGVSASKENVARDSVEEEVFLNRNIWSTKPKSKKKDSIEPVGLFQKKVKILGDGITIVKEKKSARDSFVCGACGQLGHMKTNKNCPKYREDSGIQLESKDLEKLPAKSYPLDLIAKTQQKSSVKKLIPKGTGKIAVIEAPEEEKSTLKAKVLKVKCGSMDKLPEKATPTTSQISDKPATSDTETVNRSAVKVNKIIFSNKPKHEDAHLEPHKASIVIRPPTEAERNQPRKKIIIKRPKEVIDVDQVSQEGSTGLEHRKTKKIAELSSFQEHRDTEAKHYDDMASTKTRDDRRLWEEENKRRIVERQREERSIRMYEEQQRKLEEQERVAEIRRFEEAIRIDREEELRQKEKKKKKKNKDIEMAEDYYLDDVRSRRNDRRIPDRDRSAKRKSVPDLGGRYGADYNTPIKRRRGGEVGLANILEGIVDALKERQEVSYLFLKPVTKKEAADYHKVIKRPMDLSTIKEKIRRLEYKNRDGFRHDVWQITFNAHKYNDGRNPGIPPLADQLLEICDYLLSMNDESLTEAEAGIEDNV